MTDVAAAQSFYSLYLYCTNTEDQQAEGQYNSTSVYNKLYKIYICLNYWGAVGVCVPPGLCPSWFIPYVLIPHWVMDVWARSPWASVTEDKNTHTHTHRQHNDQKENKLLLSGNKYFPGFFFLNPPNCFTQKSNKTSTGRWCLRDVNLRTSDPAHKP